MSIQMNDLPPVRRVLTAVNEQGESYIAQDGPSPAVITSPARPGYRNANIWRTSGSPASIGAEDDITEQSGVLPPKGGTVLRVIDYPPRPEDPEERRRQSAATFETIFKDAKHQPTHSRHPGMHITETVDYAIVLTGKIVAIMESGETTLNAGDILIQRGTNHGWENRTNEMSRVAYILIDGRYPQVG